MTPWSMLLNSKCSRYVVLKSKLCVLQNWPNLEKHLPFPQFSSKVFDFFGERSDKSDSFLYKFRAFKSILFWLECDIWKMDDLFQRPLGPISIILNHWGMNTRVEFLLLWKGPTVCRLACVLCHNFWTNYNLDLFSTSKWPSKLQFCERYF